MQEQDDSILSGLTEQEQSEFERLSYAVFSTEHGQLLIGHFKEMIYEQRWNPNEEANMGFFREGGSSMLRYLIGSYEEGKNSPNTYN